jgi:hypothetical protein
MYPTDAVVCSDVAVMQRPWPLAKANGFILKWVTLIINGTVISRLHTKRINGNRTFDRQHQGKFTKPYSTRIESLQDTARQLSMQVDEHLFCCSCLRAYIHMGLIFICSTGILISMWLYNVFLFLQFPSVTSHAHPCW